MALNAHSFQMRQINVTWLIFSHSDVYKRPLTIVSQHLSQSQPPLSSLCQWAGREPRWLWRPTVPRLVLLLPTWSWCDPLLLLLPTSFSVPAPKKVKWNPCSRSIIFLLPTPQGADRWWWWWWWWAGAACLVESGIFNEWPEHWLRLHSCFLLLDLLEMWPHAQIVRELKRNWLS